MMDSLPLVFSPSTPVRLAGRFSIPQPALTQQLYLRLMFVNTKRAQDRMISKKSVLLGRTKGALLRSPTI